VLDEFDRAETSCTATHAATKEAAFFVNPSHIVEIEGVTAGSKIVSFGGHPINAGLETTATATLGGGLRKNQFVSLFETIHGQSSRGQAASWLVCHDGLVLEQRMNNTALEYDNRK